MHGMQPVKSNINPSRSTRKSGMQNFAHPGRNVSAFEIKPGMAIADFGSGSGAYVLAIGEALRGMGHVYAIDVQRDLLSRVKNESARMGYKNVEVIWGDVERLYGSKLADDSIDIVLISNLLFQLSDKPSALLEANRVLKPGGRLAVIDWADSFRGMGPTQRDVVAKEKANSLAYDAGFEFVREFPAGAHHYGLIYKKVNQSI